ncbi:MAG: phosphatase PAP2 family protein [Bacteroidaceae bacterium]|nr:phosphatase PAP2 family protein [Bacteroidaceae bacterium]
MLELDQEITLALNGSESIFWDNIMYTITSTWSWILVIITMLVIMFKNNDIREFVLILISLAIMILVADRLCSGLVKPMVARWRPTQDPQIMYMVDIVNGYRGGKFGFFSGHACNTFCMATFMSLLFRYRATSVVFYLWAATTTFSRIYLGVHYVGDILVGLVVGLFIGAAFYVIYDKLSERLGSSRVSSDKFTTTGYLITDLQAFLSIVLANYILIVLIAVAQGI